MNLKEQISSLQAENAGLRSEIKLLTEKVMLLLKLQESQAIKKDSHNSHNPPSSDFSKPKRNKSLRKKTGRKSGGQPGHKGNTLKMVADPDEIVDLKSNYCKACGEDLKSLNHELVSRRQEVIIPPISPLYKEYRQYGCLCNCGHHQKATYPQGVNAPIQFGSSVIAMVSYFNVFQYVPYRRLKLLFKDIFNLSISEGSIENLLNKAAEKSNPIYQTIFEKIQTANYIGSDETGAKVNGEKWWIWVWQNVKNTFLKASDNRGFATVEQLFPNGLPNATIGSDRWAAQLKIASKNKQLCFPHLQRDLIYLIETEKTAWATQFKELLSKTLKLRHVAFQRNKAFQKKETQTQELEQELNHLLAITISKNTASKTHTFQKSMIKHRNYLFPCLYDLDVPPDNNASERAIRNVKVKQKISGQFKSGQHTFCVLRSIIDTLRKRELDVFFFLKQIMAN
jgi:transposase